MNKNTLTFERKLYTAPVCKTHVLQVEENIMSGENYGTAGSAGRGFSSGNGNINDLTEEEDF